MTASVQDVTVDGIPAVADLLARAFQDDPVMSWIFPADDVRRQRLPRFFARSSELCLKKQGHVMATDGPGGAAVWYAPGQWKMGFWQQLRQLPAMLSVFGARLPRVMSFLNLLEPHAPTEPDYYLFAIGTDPAQQGRGVGAALLAPLLARCDADNLPAHLESSNERNVPFYQRHGFVLHREIRLERGPLVYLMRRPRRDE